MRGKRGHLFLTAVHDVPEGVDVAKLMFRAMRKRGIGSSSHRPIEPRGSEPVGDNAEGSREDMREKACSFGIPVDHPLDNRDLWWDLQSGEAWFGGRWKDFMILVGEEVDRRYSTDPAIGVPLLNSSMPTVFRDSASEVAHALFDDDDVAEDIVDEAHARVEQYVHNPPLAVWFRGEDIPEESHMADLILIDLGSGSTYLAYMSNVDDGIDDWHIVTEVDPKNGPSIVEEILDEVAWYQRGMEFQGMPAALGFGPPVTREHVRNDYRRRFNSRLEDPAIVANDWKEWSTLLDTGWARLTRWMEEVTDNRWQISTPAQRDVLLDGYLDLATGVAGVGSV